ncbi:MAG: hypothetical protein KF878_34875 [Planctomycetes bacterium]|nr:hypothetical protein [Planctomycetota bacterium]
MRRRVRRAEPPPPPVVVTDARRVVVWRAVVGAMLLAIAAGVASHQAFGEVEPADVLLGAALGLLAGPLALGERAARLGRPWAAFVWCAGLAVVGLLAGAVQAGFAARVWATGTTAGAHAASYADVWIAALDPSTLPVVALRALPFALLPVIAGRWGRAGLLIGAVVLALPLPALLGWASDPLGDPAVHLPGHDAAWGLPTGPRAVWPFTEHDGSWLLAARALWSPPEVRLTSLVLRSLPLDVLALTLTALLADLLARRRATSPAARPSRRLPLARALPALGVLALAALAILGHRPPPAFLVAPLVDLVEDDQGRGLAEGLLHRLGPDDAGAVGPLAQKLADPASAQRRRFAATLLARIGPPAAVEALPALGEALRDEPEVAWAVLDAIAALGPAARPLTPALLRTRLAFRFVSDPRNRWSWREEDEVPLHVAVDALLQRLGQGEVGREDLLAFLDDRDDTVVAGALRELIGRADLQPDDAARFYEVARRGVAVEAAIQALAWHHRPAVALLRERAAQSDLDGDDPILLLLRSSLPDDLSDVFERLARHADAGVRRAVAEALDLRHPVGRSPFAPDLLLALLGDPDARVHDAAARALRSQYALAADPVAAALDARGPVALPAAALLGELGVHGQSAVPALVRALADGPPDLRLASARSLGRLVGGVDDATTRGEVLDALLAATLSADEALAVEALAALGSFASTDEAPRVRDALLAALDAPSPEVRARAAVTLVHAGGPTHARRPRPARARRRPAARDRRARRRAAAPRGLHGARRDRPAGARGGPGARPRRRGQRRRDRRCAPSTRSGLDAPGAPPWAAPCASARPTRASSRPRSSAARVPAPRRPSPTSSPRSTTPSRPCGARRSPRWTASTAPTASRCARPSRREPPARRTGSRPPSCAGSFGAWPRRRRRR